MVMFLGAPFIADFYKQPLLTNVTRIACLTIPIGALCSVHSNLLYCQLRFRDIAIGNILATFFSGGIGLLLAYNGYGVWALVAQYLINTCTDTIVLWVTVKWRPEWIFSWERAKGLIRYGWKMLASGLLDTGYTQLRSLLIGKVYTTEDLAYYNQGDKYSSFVIKNINTSISAVLLPAMSQIQDDRERVKEMTRKSIQVSSYVIWPLMIGVAAVADPFVRVVLTEKWIDCVPYLQVLCFSYALWPIHTSNLQAINALGRSDIFLKLEIIKKIIGIVIIFVSLQFGPYAIAVGCLVDGLVATVINAYPNAKLINYTYWEQLKDIFPSMLLAMIMGAVVYPIQYLKINNACILFVQIVVGGVVYIILSIITKQKTLKYILDTVKQHN
jgi:O-antigen/teichoic acid export membrane protein